MIRLESSDSCFDVGVDQRQLEVIFTRRVACGICQIGVRYGGKIGGGSPVGDVAVTVPCCEDAPVG